MEFLSLTKDYDIYYLANKFDFDREVFTEALKKTFANRNRNFTLRQFENMIDFLSDDAMQKNGKHLSRKLILKLMTLKQC